ncbi:MAG: amino acid ABC transporter permease [Parvibaculaceae bacterium]
MTADMIMGVATGIPWTLAVTAAAFVLGAALGLPLCAMRVSKFAPLRFVALTYVILFRSIPPLLLVFFFFFGLGSGYLPISAFEGAILGLGLITAANMAEIYRGALSAIHMGQWEASEALALPSYSTYLDIIAPQLLRVSLPSSASYAVGLLKESAIASTIGVADISFNANYIAKSTYQGLAVFAIAALFYITISLPIATLARAADQQLRARVAL